MGMESERRRSARREPRRGVSISHPGWRRRQPHLVAERRIGPTSAWARDRAPPTTVQPPGGPRMT
ncbi:MAG: hypothetical protein MZW92_74930 [Comamonadaceae bacterium]|nr:hypothetical protein [Comamonadaceae bacterium]